MLCRSICFSPKSAVRRAHLSGSWGARNERAVSAARAAFPADVAGCATGAIANEDQIDYGCARRGWPSCCCRSGRWLLPILGPIAAQARSPGLRSAPPRYDVERWSGFYFGAGTWLFRPERSASTAARACSTSTRAAASARCSPATTGRSAAQSPASRPTSAPAVSAARSPTAAARWVRGQRARLAARPLGHAGDAADAALCHGRPGLGRLRVSRCPVPTPSPIRCYGYQVGAGVEYMIAPQWTMRARVQSTPISARRASTRGRSSTGTRRSSIRSGPASPSSSDRWSCRALQSGRHDAAGAPCCGQGYDVRDPSGGLLLVAPRSQTYRVSRCCRRRRRLRGFDALRLIWARRTPLQFKPICRRFRLPASAGALPARSGPCPQVTLLAVLWGASRLLLARCQRRARAVSATAASSQQCVQSNS